MIFPIPIVNNLTFEMKEIDPKRRAAYGQGIRNNVYGLWIGVFDKFTFVDSVSSSFRRGLTLAWMDGAAQCGIKPEDYTPDERMALSDMINREIMFVTSFANAIADNSRDNGGKLGPLNQRTTLWVNRYNDAYNTGMRMACKDSKMMWVLGATERHCNTCAGLAGTVLRGSEWTRSGYVPQSPPNAMLECGGWKCDCRFEVTTSPVTSRPSIMMSL